MREPWSGKKSSCSGPSESLNNLTSFDARSAAPRFGSLSFPHTRALRISPEEQHWNAFLEFLREYRQAVTEGKFSDGVITRCESFVVLTEHYPFPTQHAPLDSMPAFLAVARTRAPWKHVAQQLLDTFVHLQIVCTINFNTLLFNIGVCVLSSDLQQHEHAARKTSWGTIRDILLRPPRLFLSVDESKGYDFVADQLCLFTPPAPHAPP